MSISIDKEFPKGILRPELFIGAVSYVNAQNIRINLSEAGNPSGSHFSGGRYGRGEVGEFVIIEGQQVHLLGRVIEVRLPEKDRRTIQKDYEGNPALDAIGNIVILGSIAIDDLQVSAGVSAYPRLGDRVYAAPHKFVSKIPMLMEHRKDSEKDSPVLLTLGSIDVAQESTISIKPEKLFGRHCAILGATGGGKSWTTARVIEECLQHNSKIILLDATGEYRDFSGDKVLNCHLGEPVEKADGSIPCSLPPTGFNESDFIALFEPSGKTQGPKLRAAIRSLRLVKIKPVLASDGLIVKANQEKQPIEQAEREHSSQIENPNQPFEVNNLVPQIIEECVQPGWNNSPTWGNRDENSVSYCLTMLTRIEGVLRSPAFGCVFNSDETKLTEQINQFLDGNKNLLRICMSGIAYEFNAREIIANVIGRYVLNEARNGKFKDSPVIFMLDEAHNFLGRHIGSEEFASKLDAFELIAKEGRKFGLNICLATQRPRDITEGVLSQMGTLIVHRLTNDRDREVVERACGEIDRAASAFLPNLKPGEAAIIGVDFPIPMTVQINKPSIQPKSDGANFQESWQNNGI